MHIAMLIIINMSMPCGREMEFSIKPVKLHASPEKIDGQGILNSTGQTTKYESRGKKLDIICSLYFMPPFDYGRRSEIVELLIPQNDVSKLSDPPMDSRDPGSHSQLLP